MLQDITLQVGVKIIIRDKQGKFLLLHRSQEKYPDVEDRWDIPGGRISPGTSLLENLKREIKEETGLELVGEPQLIAAQDIMPKPERHIVRLTYTGIASGEVTLDGVEHDAYQWYTDGDLKDLENLDKYLREILPVLRGKTSHDPEVQAGTLDYRA